MILDIDVGNSFIKWRLSGVLGVAQRGSQSTPSVVEEGLDLSISGPLTQARLSSVASGSVTEILRQQLKGAFGVELQKLEASIVAILIALRLALIAGSLSLVLILSLAVR